MNPVTSLVLVPTPPSPFEVARIEAQAQATMKIAASLVAEANVQVSRAQSLLESAAAMMPPSRETARIQAAISVREAIEKLCMLLPEIET